jgi:hypothetical protein
MGVLVPRDATKIEVVNQAGALLTFEGAPRSIVEKMTEAGIPAYLVRYSREELTTLREFDAAGARGAARARMGAVR